MSEGSGDIIIKGGSVQISFDEGLYQKNPYDPGSRSNDLRKIGRIRIMDENGRMMFDSGDHPGGLNWRIEVSTK